MDNQIVLSSDMGCSSFELKKTSRGYSWNIKVYHSDIQKSYDIAKEINHQASQDFDTSIISSDQEGQ